MHNTIIMVMVWDTLLALRSIVCVESPFEKIAFENLNGELGSKLAFHSTYDTTTEFNGWSDFVCLNTLKIFIVCKTYITIFTIMCTSPSKRCSCLQYKFLILVVKIPIFLMTNMNGVND